MIANTYINSDKVTSAQKSAVNELAIEIIRTRSSAQNLTTRKIRRDLTTCLARRRIRSQVKLVLVANSMKVNVPEHTKMRSNMFQCQSTLVKKVHRHATSFSPSSKT